MSDAVTGESIAPVVLEVKNLTVHHGQLRAVDDVSFSVRQGEVLTVIGANGAGKSTLLRTIAGLHTQSSGSIIFEGKDVSRVAPHRRFSRGISLVPEGRRLFSSLTLEENLLVGATKGAKGAFTLEAIYEIFPWMLDRRRAHVWQFSGGEQQAVAIGRALIANPKLILLDEVSLGLAPIVIERIYEVIPRIVAQGVTVLIVEQDVSQGLKVATRVHCLLEGRTSLVGTPGELSDAQIERAYFGASLEETPSHGDAQ
jgi:branched-chain amino acid transport system ATP-binding protein